MPIPERLAILKNNEGWFGRAPKEFQDAVLSRCAWVTCPAGQPIYQATETHVNFCGSVEGAVEIDSRFGAGDNPLLHIVYEGSWIGYGTVVGRSALLDNHDRRCPGVLVRITGLNPARRAGDELQAAGAAVPHAQGHQHTGTYHG